MADLDLNQATATTAAAGASDDINALPPPPAEGEGSDKIKDDGPRRESGLEAQLSITSLMDAFTILLVFLLMSYAADPTQITQSEDLQLVQSTETLASIKAVPVAITKKFVLVNEQPIVEIQNGKVPATAKRDGGDGYFIIPLAERLKEEAEKQRLLEKIVGGSGTKRFKFEGRIMVVADKDVPFRLLTEVMYTAGQSEFGNFMFAAIGD